MDEAEKTDKVAIMVTSHGGHIGFLEGLMPRHKSLMDRVFSQYVGAIFSHGEELLSDEPEDGSTSLTEQNRNKPQEQNSVEKDKNL